MARTILEADEEGDEEEEADMLRAEQERQALEDESDRREGIRLMNSSERDESTEESSGSRDALTRGSQRSWLRRRGGHGIERFAFSQPASGRPAPRGQELTSAYPQCPDDAAYRLLLNKFEGHLLFAKWHAQCGAYACSHTVGSALRHMYKQAFVACEHLGNIGISSSTTFFIRYKIVRTLYTDKAVVVFICHSSNLSCHLGGQWD